MTAEKVLKIATGEIGVTEYPPNSNKVKYNTWYYGREVSGSAYPWCMVFVQWCYEKAGLPLPYRTAGCSGLLNWYKKNAPERIVKAPRPGDIVIYSFGHTGILESAEGGSITAIEGNTSADYNGSQSNGGGVFRRVRKANLVTAYIRPYDFEEDEDMTGEEIYKKLNEYLYELEAPAWADEEMSEAINLGITDGTRPMQLIPRYQAAIMALRAYKKAAGRE